MIRRLIPSDIPAVLELWLRSTKQGIRLLLPAIGTKIPVW